MSESNRPKCRSRRIGLVSSDLPLTRHQKRQLAAMARRERRREQSEREANERRADEHLGPELKKIDPDSAFGRQREERIAKYTRLAQERAELFDGVNIDEDSEDDEDDEA